MFTTWVILASATLAVMSGSVIAPVLNMMRSGLGVDPASVGLIITTHGLFVAIFSPLIGILIDRVGYKKPFIFGLFMYGIIGGSGLFINTYWGLIISRAFFGIAVAAIFTSITVIVLNRYKGVARDKITGWRGSSSSFGGIAWPLLGGFLGRFSWHLPFAAYLLSIPLGLLAMFAIPAAPKEKTQDAGYVSQKDSVLSVFRNTPVLFIIYGLMFLAMILLYVIVIFLPQRLEQFGILDSFQISLYLSTLAIAAGLTSLLYGRIRASLSYKTIVIAALALWAIGFTAISQASSSLLILPSIALFGIGQGMTIPALTVWVGETVPMTLRGRISSYLTTFGFLGQFLSPIIFSPVVTSLGLNGVFFVAGGTCAALLLLFLVGTRKWQFT